MKPERIAHQIWHAQPVAITVALSVASVRMARRDVIVHKLPAGPVPPGPEDDGSDEHGSV